MDELEDNIYEEQDSSLTFEEVLEILEAEMYSDYDNPYKPLDFNTTDEDY
jgi:hypothetical protein